MSRILILFATIDGQTGRIAQRVAQALRAQGHDVTVRPASVAHAADDARDFDAFILGAGIRFGKHAKYLIPIVRERVTPLTIPTAFFSVCLTAGGPGARPEAAQRYVDEFLGRTGWKPAQAESFGGALLYTRYSFAIRNIIRFIMRVTGGELDTSRDHEYTDWDAVVRYAERFGRRLVRTPAPAHA